MASDIFIESLFSEVNPEVIVKSLTDELLKMGEYQSEGIVENILMIFKDLTDLQKLVFGYLFLEWEKDRNFRLNVTLEERNELRDGRLPPFPNGFMDFVQKNKLISIIRAFLGATEYLIDDHKLNEEIWNILTLYSGKLPFITYGQVYKEPKIEIINLNIREEAIEKVSNELKRHYFISRDNTHLIPKKQNEIRIGVNNWSIIQIGRWIPYGLNTVIKQLDPPIRDYRISLEHRKVLDLTQEELGKFLEEVIRKTFPNLNFESENKELESEDEEES